MKSFLQTLIIVGFVNCSRAKVGGNGGSLRGQDTNNTLAMAWNHQRSFGPRIFGGTEATPGRYKHYVSLRHNVYGHFCGGTLLAPDTVLSAAHCGGGLYQVVIDSHDLSSVGEEDMFDIDKEIIHPRYLESEDTANHDYMLLFLKEPVTSRNHTVEYIKLNTNPLIPASGDSVKVIGHGITEESAVDLSNLLLEVEVSVISNEECKENSYAELTDAMLCAADPNEDSCQGDSGGPLFVEGNHPDGAEDVQVGIVSWGFGCAQEKFPGVYSRISEGYEWIRRQVCTNSDSPSEDFDCANLPQTTIPPTASPTTKCPATYDPSKTYAADDQVEFNFVVYQCLAGSFTEYCSISKPNTEWDLTEYTLWKYAWISIGECDSKQGESFNNSNSPTGAPSQFSSPTTPTTSSPTPSDSSKLIHRAADGCIRTAHNEVQVDLCLASEHTSPVSVNCCAGSIGGGDLMCDRQGCFATANFESAKSHCETKNMRLCTRVELETDVCCSLGCGFDRNITWTSDTDCSEPIR
jgi:secreted trypsin-like serine protease